MHFRNERGHTVINLLTTMALIGILSAAAVSNLKEMNDPLANASFSVEHFLRLARSSAISRTQAVQVAPSSRSTLIAASGDTCSSTMTAISSMTLALPRGAEFVATDWSVCFTKRGLADANTVFQLIDGNGNTKTVRVALGGGTRIQ